MVSAPRKPVMLDLFCKAGGAARGYQRAGFYVIGIDRDPQPRFAGDEFVQGDVFEVVPRLLDGGCYFIDAAHASSPCQRHSTLRSVVDMSGYEDLVEPTRRLLMALGVPWISENVPGAPLRADLTLCGAMFGLRSYRHRIFELSHPVPQPPHPKHTVRVNRRGENRRAHWDAGGFLTITGDVGTYCGPEAMGIDWMTGAEMSEAIPPAYSEYIGRHYLALAIEQRDFVKQQMRKWA